MSGNLADARAARQARSQAATRNHLEAVANADVGAVDQAERVFVALQGVVGQTIAAKQVERAAERIVDPHADIQRAAARGQKTVRINRKQPVAGNFARAGEVNQWHGAEAGPVDPYCAAARWIDRKS